MTFACEKKKKYNNASGGCDEHRSPALLNSSLHSIPCKSISYRPTAWLPCTGYIYIYALGAPFETFRTVRRAAP